MNPLKRAQAAFTSKLDIKGIGEAVDDMRNRAKDARMNFERHWYDNNFFDDGYHFRYWSRQQNKIIDLSSNSTIYNPMRAIPKASRQIRGIANLLLSTDPTPIVYPEKVNASAFTPEEFEAAYKEAKKVARLTGHWLSEEWKEQDLMEKLAHQVILAAKHGVAYMQVWPDPIEERIKTQVFDAFDVFLDGTLTDIEDCPFVIKTQRRFIAEIKADERFDPEQVAKISPDSRYASSEIKDAYMKDCHQGVSAETTQSLIEKEAFIKEYIDEDNTPRIRAQKNGEEILKNRKKGDPILRQVFVEGNVAVKDSYVTLPGYPLVDFRFEPGPLYQVPTIERFIPTNKSLDLIISRVERYLHTMTTGIYMKRKGEDFELNNTPGGQMVEYSQTKPEQMQLAAIPANVDRFIGILNQQLEEQGVTTTTLGKIPPGVRANAAIESLKESELANLIIHNRRLQGTVKRISEKMLDLADNYFLTPQTVMYLEKGEPAYFDIIGKGAIAKRAELKIDTPRDVVPISKNYRVDIQVEKGLGYTKEGQKAAAKELGDWFVEMAKLQLIDPKVVQLYTQQLMEVYGFGATQEIMEALEQVQAGMQPQQVDQMKLAMLQTMGDLQKAGMFPTQDQRIEENKVGVAQTAADLNKNGIPDNQEGNG